MQQLRRVLAVPAIAFLGLAALTITGAPAGAAIPAQASDIRINEVESNGGDPADWVELANLGDQDEDLSGWVLRDNDDSHTFAIAAGTTVPAHGYAAVVVDDGSAQAFGLGGADSARVFAPDGTLVDSYSWTSHAATTYGRCPDGTGDFVTTASSTKGAANDCSAPPPPPPPTGGGSGPIVFNEVESNGDTEDWAELTNIGTTTVDLSGDRFLDNDDTHTPYAIPAGTSLAPGAFYVLHEADFGFGLGAPDSVRLFSPDGSTLIDSFSWTSHAATTYGLCPDGTGEWTTTTAGTKGAANACAPTGAAGVAIDEIMTNDPAGGPDWIELANTGSAAVDLSGWVLRDNKDSDADVIPAGTTIEPGGHLAFDTDAFFGLGSGDSARLYQADGTTLVDSFTWTSHGAPTWGRCPDGTGAFTQTQLATKAAANICPGDIVADPWPGGADVRTVDPQGTWSSNLSGLSYDHGRMWAVQNGPGTLWKVTQQGDTWAPEPGEWAAGKALHYPDGTGDPDAEGVVLGDDGSIYVSTERNNEASGVSRPEILEFDQTRSGSSLDATDEWNLTPDLPGLGANLGAEAIAEVPDSYLVAHAFVDESTGAAYDPARYPGHGDGLFFVGIEQTGQVIGYALQPGGVFTRVATVKSGFAGVMDLEWEPETRQLWAECDDTCQGRTATFAVGDDGALAPTAYYERPAGMPNLNNEGFAIAPRSECVDGLKPVWWSDDSADGGFSLREGTLGCTPPAATTTTMTRVPDGMRVTVSSASGTPTGTIQLWRLGTLLGSADLVDGSVTVTNHDLHGVSSAVTRAVYLGSDDFAGSRSGG